MLPNKIIKDAFIEDFPGSLSIRDSQHRIIYLNESVKEWLKQFIDISVIGLTNKQIKKLISNKQVAELFDEKNDTSIEEIENGDKKNTVVKFYHDGRDNFFDIYKFTKEFNGEKYIYTMTVDITESYNKMMFFKNKAQRDPLTGAYNRSILDNIITSNSDIYVYFDIDSFKQINDNFGHSVGDEVLCRMVKAIKHNVREEDVLIRMGGDEFLLILKNANTVMVNEIIRRIKKETLWDKPKIAFAYGVKRYRGTIDETLKEVDRLMYRDKQKRIKCEVKKEQ